MGRNTWLILALCYLKAAAAAALTPEQYVLSPTLEHSPSRWPFNFSSSAPHIFGSVQGLLQQWSNTFFPIGHSIVPCEIKPFTNIYHGRLDADLPPSPEWVAFDIEMSYGIMGSTQNSHILTYQTTKPLKCLYFDGMSAALSNNGEMDGQMHFIYGNTSGSPEDPNNRGRGLFDEYDRADKLCGWAQDHGLGGPGWGVEGIVRMNAGFEMIVCNFTSPSLRLMSHLNVSAPLLDKDNNEDDDGDELVFESMKEVTSSYLYPLPTTSTISPPGHSTDPAEPPIPPNWRRNTGLEPFLRPQTWNWLRSATWHYGSTGMGPGIGESRVRALTCGFATFHADKFSSLQHSRVELQKKSLNLTSEGFWMGIKDTKARNEGLQDLLRRRRAPRLTDLNATDAALMNADMSRILHSLGFSENASSLQIPQGNACSGLEWDSLISQIVTRYSNSLPEFLKTISHAQFTLTENYTVFRNNITVVRDHTHSFLVPFLEYPSRVTKPNDSSRTLTDVWSLSSTLARDTYSRCKYQHTRLLQPDEGVSLGPEEMVLKEAVEETLGAICDVIVTVGFEMEKRWLTVFNAYDGSHASDWRAGIEEELRHWQYGVEELLAWLGWAGNKAKCEKTCDVDEQCFIPMWPLINRGRMGGPPPGYGNPYHRRPCSGHGGPRERPEEGHGGGRYGPGGPPGGPPPGYGHGPPPGFFGNEDDLWTPKCVKNDYLEQGWF